MGYESGAQITAYFAEETTYGVPVAPMGSGALQVISFNFADDSRYVEDRTVYAKNPICSTSKRGTLTRLGSWSATYQLPT